MPPSLTEKESPVALSERDRLALETLPPVAAVTFAERMGVTADTLRAWIAKGYLRVQNLCGQNYVPAAEAVIFNRRLAAGEFAIAKNPPRGRVSKCRMKNAECRMKKPERGAA